MQEIKTYKTKDLILNVSKVYDPTILDLTAWDRFLDVLCDNRHYQIEAIKTAIIYLGSGRYKGIEDLIKDNWNDTKNAELRNRYRDLKEYLDAIQLPKRLSANIDLATGTGKSYVIYGIAQIALGIGLIDKVLVLCPSLTIEKELTKKFISLSGDSALKNTLPIDSQFQNPRIIDANSTIKAGDICVENIHAVYDRTGSSIQDSLLLQGNRVLILSDESHHIYNRTDGATLESRSIRKWKEFLLDPTYNFFYMLGFTGTAYNDNEYFNDVIFRYSLRQAVDDKVIKSIDYVSKNDDVTANIKFQEILDNHRSNQETYRRIKPLTIFVTKDIRNAKQLASDFTDFLVGFTGVDEVTAQNQCLVVSSSPEHKLNVSKLNNVDATESSIQYIFSVSMLTEGWDVKNVFQIVPWEDRAFNSKLLIAQVLGRGLRLPPAYRSPQPKVRVYNHDAWSKNIRGLVDELLELEMRLTSSSLTESQRSKYHFDLFNIDYDKIATEKESNKEHSVFDYKKGYINLLSQQLDLEKDTEYTDLSGLIRSKNTLIHYHSYSVEEVVNSIYNDLNAREWEGKILQLPEGQYTKNELPPKENIEKLIRESMRIVGIKGNHIDENNRQKILSSFSTLLRKKGKTVHNVRKATDPIKLSTRLSSIETISIGNLKNRSAAYISTSYESELSGENLKILQELLTSNEESLEAKYNIKTINEFIFKTPFDIVFVSHEPELKFLNQLIKKDNAQYITAWCKSRDVGFYSIEYSITSVAGKHSKIQSFNPDFFIKIIQGDFEYIIVIETKADNDISSENRAKYKYAKQHFSDLNDELKNKNILQKYLFHFLSPNSYAFFFEYLRDGRLVAGNFRGDLEDKLQDEENS